ncbi:MAG: PD-(D/E)XK nuclease family protein [Duncaniella sp.]|nr:PD-(D/E)XK nuclease family protein [Duncaniella sp.]
MSKELLMVDSTSVDGKAEFVMDYIISYTLRSCQNEDMPKFRMASRAILFNLLGIEDDGQEIVSVKVWKQWRQIDLTVEVILSMNGEDKKYAILIEDKYYTAPHNNQLARYKEIFNSHYDADVEKRYVLITAIYRDDENFDKCYANVTQDGFTVFSLKELLAANQGNTESDIFNQFWLGDWH